MRSIKAARNEARPQLTAAAAAGYTVAAILGGKDHWDPEKH